MIQRTAFAFSRVVFLLAIASVISPVFAGRNSDTQQRFTPSELRADFTAMYQGLQSAAFDLYAFTPKTELDRSYRDTLAGLNKPMTLLQAQIRFEEFASLVRMGHTRVDFPRAIWTQYLEDGGKAFPLAIRVVDGKTIVAQNESGIDAIACGDEILEINGVRMQEWLKRTERHVSAETSLHGAFAHGIRFLDLSLG